MLITYDGEGELLVCTSKTEKRLLKEWFKGGVRDVELYDRTKHEDGILAIQAEISVNS